MKAIAFLLTIFVSAVASAQQTPTTGYAPVKGLKMYYEVHGTGEPVVLLHGAFMTITNNWTGWIGELSKTRKVIAVEMQGHGRTADIERSSRPPKRRCFSSTAMPTASGPITSRKCSA
jgi:pimeloyl-ACP methyl ester carboxylesterase